MFVSQLSRYSRPLAAAAIAVLAIACGATEPTSSPQATRPPTPAPTLAPTLLASSTPTAPASTPTVEPSLPGPPPTATPGGLSLLLEVTTEGGFIAPSAHLGELPVVVVDTAGDIYSPGPAPACPSGGNCGTLIPLVDVRDVGANGAAQILAAMRVAGLDKEGSSGVPGDAGVTVFTAQIDGQEVVNRIAAIGPGGPGHPGSSPQPAIDLLGRLLDPSVTWGAADSTEATFTPTAYKIYVAPATSTSSDSVNWPLSAPLAEFGTPATPDFGVAGLRTGVVFGDDAATLMAGLANTPAGALMVSDGKTYQVWIRPLLPPELSQ